MIGVIYIENDVAHHPRTEALCRRFARAVRVPCDNYAEIFNRKSQNFRLQKQRPALILAAKRTHHVLPAPSGYGVGGPHNYYFSHMLNCLYDCRYCFLQGMYRSAHYVVFVNYETFETAIVETVTAADGEECWFFSGYDCDSLAFEPMTQFCDHFLPLFARLPNAWLELRTKSTQIRALLEREPLPNCVVAFSLSPEHIVRALEQRTPSLERRLQAIAKLQARGWPVGIRFDPVIYENDYQQVYARFFEEVFSRLDAERLHSVSLGSFRLPEDYFHTMLRLYPDAPLFAGPLEGRHGTVAYRGDLEQSLSSFCTERLRRYVPEQRLYPCIAGSDPSFR